MLNSPSAESGSLLHCCVSVRSSFWRVFSDYSLSLSRSPLKKGADKSVVPRFIWTAGVGLMSSVSQPSSLKAFYGDSLSSLHEISVNRRFFKWLCVTALGLSCFQVAHFADQVKSRFPELNVLLCNAGVLNPRRAETKDGLEMTFQVEILFAQELRQSRWIVRVRQNSSPTRACVQVDVMWLQIPL